MALYKHLYSDRKATQPFLVDVIGKVAIGASGAVGTATGKGFTVARTGAGVYTITLDARGGVPNVLYAHASIVAAIGSQSRVFVTLINTTTGVITVTNTGAGDTTAADPANGAVLQFAITVQNSKYTG